MSTGYEHVVVLFGSEEQDYPYSVYLSGHEIGRMRRDPYPHWGAAPHRYAWYVLRGGTDYGEFRSKVEAVEWSRHRAQQEWSSDAAG